MTAKLSIAQDKVDDLKVFRCEAQSRSHTGTTAEGRPDDLEVGSLIRELKDAQDDCLRILGPFTMEAEKEF